MDKDKGQRKEPLVEEEDGVVEVMPPGEGAGRSTRDRELPPSPQEEDKGESWSSGRGTREKEQARDEVADPLKEVSLALDHLEVNPKVKVGTANGGDVIGKRALGHQQQLVVEMGMDPSKMGGSLAKLGEAHSPSPAMNSNSTTESFEDQEGKGEESFEKYPAEEEEESAHPCLFIENVLDVIFKHIVEQPRTRRRQDVAKDVQSIRLVCKAWKDSVTLAYRRSAPAITFDYEESEEYGQYNKFSLQEFMDTMKFSQLIPVQKFQFCASVFHQGNRNPELFGDFLRLCGPEVASLDICIVSYNSETLTLDSNDLPEFNMPKLKTLKLEIHDLFPCQVELLQIRSEITTNIDTEHREIVDLVGRLLIAAKTLHFFGLSYPRYCRCSPQSQGHPDNILMQQLGQVIAIKIPRTVKELDLAMEISETTFNNLVERGLELGTFKFRVEYILDSKTLYQFLQSQAASLNALKIGWDYFRDDRIVYVEFPRLLELVQLNLGDVIISTTDPWDFAKTFPKLNHLDLSEMSSVNALQTVIGSVRKPSQSLKVLHFPVFFYDSLVPIIKTTAQSFPSLEELHIRLSSNTRETMEEVCKYFDNLESLNLCFPGSIRTVHWMDSLFSGIPESDCIRLKTLQDFENEDVIEIQRRPSLLNLTKLRKLVVNIGARYPLTDISAHFVFLEMSNLCEINLANWDVQFSPRYMELLKDKLVLQVRD